VPHLSYTTSSSAAKGCEENIEARLLTLPDGWVIEVCPFCAGRRRYLPEEILRDGFRTNTHLYPAS